jgi:Cdc6-like AAA superfamily ATPase
VGVCINDPEDVLSQLCFPEKIVCREGEIKEIERHLYSSRQGKSIHNVLIFGPAGSGKTTIAKWLMRKFFAHNSAYVNCWEQRSKHKIFQEILQQVGSIVHGRESTSDLAKKLEKLKRKPVIFLDESDQMETDALYSIGRNSSGVVMISDRPFSEFKVDDRIRSSLFIKEIALKPYSSQDLIEILKYRLREEYEEEMDEDSLFLIASISSGDARIAIQTLKFAMHEARSENRVQLTSEDIIRAVRSSASYKSSCLLSSLNEHQKKIYEILKRSRMMDSGKLFDEYCRTVKDHVVDRAYRNYIGKMEQLGLVRSDRSGRWKRYSIV